VDVTRVVVLDTAHPRCSCTTPPKAQLFKLVNFLKGVSAPAPAQGVRLHVRRHLWGGHFWSSSYFVGSCGGAPLTVVRQYIENQHRPA
jgi:putative transposase